MYAVYQNTKEQRYLDTSRRMATYFVTNTPSNGIVPWYVLWWHDLPQVAQVYA